MCSRLCVGRHHGPISTSLVRYSADRISASRLSEVQSFDDARQHRARTPTCTVFSALSAITYLRPLPPTKVLCIRRPLAGGFKVICTRRGNAGRDRPACNGLACCLLGLRCSADEACRILAITRPRVGSIRRIRTKRPGPALAPRRRHFLVGRVHRRNTAQRLRGGASPHVRA